MTQRPASERWPGEMPEKEKIMNQPTTLEINTRLETFTAITDNKTGLDAVREAVIGIECGVSQPEPTNIVIIANRPYELIEHVTIPFLDLRILSTLLTGLLHVSSGFAVRSVWMDPVGLGSVAAQYFESMKIPLKTLLLHRKMTDDVFLRLFDAIQNGDLILHDGLEGFRKMPYEAICKNQHAFALAWHGIRQRDFRVKELNFVDIG